MQCASKAIPYNANKCFLLHIYLSRWKRSWKPTEPIDTQHLRSVQTTRILYSIISRNVALCSVDIWHVTWTKGQHACILTFMVQGEGRGVNRSRASTAWFSLMTELTDYLTLLAQSRGYVIILQCKVAWYLWYRGTTWPCWSISCHTW